jgi:hypothetical protein
LAEEAPISYGDLGIDIEVSGNMHAVLDVDGTADLDRNANRRSYPGTVEIEIRTGFCNPGGEVLAVRERSGRRRITAQRRGLDRPSRMVVR